MSTRGERIALAQCSKIDWAKRRAEGAANPQRIVLTERAVEPRSKDKIQPGYNTPGPMPGKRKKPKGPTPEESKERKRRRKEKRRAAIAARRRCAARRVDGKQCRSRATSGELCGVHAKTTSVQRKERDDSYESYDEYLRSAHWIDFKRKFYEIYVAECAFCKASDGVDLHHRTYAHRGSESFSDVVPLCREHHYECHAFDKQHPEFTLGQSTAMWLDGAQPTKCE